MNFGRIRLRHLQAFLAVARSGNLRKAAEALAVTQPAVTKTINELEEILKVRLFERGRRGALLTAEAEVFLRHASASIGELELAIEGVTGNRATALLRFGVLPTVTSSFVPSALHAFKAASPATRVRVVSGSNPQLLLQLQQRDLDLVVGRLSEPAAMTGLTFEHLYAERLVVAVRPGHPLLASGRAAIGALQDFEAVLPMAGTIIRHTADSFMATHGMRPSPGWVETLSISLGRALVLGSDALWFVPHGAVQPDLAARTLMQLPVSTEGTEEPVGLLLGNETMPTGALQLLITALRFQAQLRRAAAR